MARSRNIKPGFFVNEELAECDVLARILFAGLWTLADREGRLEDRPKKIKAALLPYDDCDIESLLAQLEQGGFIARYEVDNRSCIWVVSFHDHQRPHHMEEPSKLPPPPDGENKYNHSPITKVQRDRIIARDKGKCVECGSGHKIHIDHIVPVSKGGTSDDKNLRVLCKKCNLKKGNRTQAVIELSTTQHQSNELASRRTDSLNLVTDSLNPQLGLLDSCVETGIPSPTPASLTFPCDGKPDSWGLLDEQLDQWQELYPSLDVAAECRSALAWVLAVPSRRKTHGGMTRFLVGWLARSQNSGSSKQAKPTDRKATWATTEFDT